jgi:benzoyl-CoA reductase subunit D
VQQLGELSRKSKNAVAMNAQCAVFAESEVVTLVHQQTPKEDMARAVHDAIASRIISMVRKVGFEKDVMLIGGVAKNVGFVDAMNRGLEMEVVVPQDPEFVGAIGAAVAAAQG